MDKGPRRWIRRALARSSAQFGKGSVMKLGQRESSMEIEIDIDRARWARYRARHRRPAEGAYR
jgi:hypothetical protein